MFLFLANSSEFWCKFWCTQGWLPISKTACITPAKLVCTKCTLHQYNNFNRSCKVGTNLTTWCCCLVETFFEVTEVSIGRQLFLQLNQKRNTLPGLTFLIVQFYEDSWILIFASIVEFKKLKQIKDSSV